MTKATAAANTASSHRSDLIARRSARAALAARLVTAHGVEALRNVRHLEAEGDARELLQLRGRIGSAFRARVEVALHPGARRAQVLSVARLVAREERGARIEQAQAQVLAH